MSEFGIIRASLFRAPVLVSLLSVARICHSPKVE